MKLSQVDKFYMTEKAPFGWEKGFKLFNFRELSIYIKFIRLV
ncbi:hypothetical protein GXM_03162 [Nostoc sphaeroides CCNUC1]|uniref:Uncharacterized protein n=1 Tax=Nostoc sphaeroides CCNUC1 TaxID=2653204 RepID=A0A5P8VZ35_9NOSO|nr:hypothetical protein GXM_03162 [Nostoc sphaeroides CCNUC1]